MSSRYGVHVPASSHFPPLCPVNGKQALSAEGRAWLAYGKSLPDSGWACYFLLSRLAARRVSQHRELAPRSSAPCPPSDRAGGISSPLSATVLLADLIQLRCLQFWFLGEQQQGYPVPKSLLKAKYDFEEKFRVAFGRKKKKKSLEKPQPPFHPPKT